METQRKKQAWLWIAVPLAGICLLIVIGWMSSREHPAAMLGAGPEPASMPAEGGYGHMR